MVIFCLRKIVLHHEISNKTRTAKIQENSAHRFRGNYLTNNLVKFLQDRIKPWRVGALRVCTDYHFFKQKSLVRAFQPSLTFCVFMLTIIIKVYESQYIALFVVQRIYWKVSKSFPNWLCQHLLSSINR